MGRRWSQRVGEGPSGAAVPSARCPGPTDREPGPLHLPSQPCLWHLRLGLPRLADGVSHSLIRTERRRHLAVLDNLLNELEWLNLANRCDVPDDLATRLEQRGVGAASKKGPPELIEAVFNLQRPFLRPNSTAVRPQAVPSLRQPVAAGWLIV
jgi:hypothetical protein